MTDLEPIADHDRELGFRRTPFAYRHFPMFGDLAHGVAANRQKHDLLGHMRALQRIGDVASLMAALTDRTVTKLMGNDDQRTRWARGSSLPADFLDIRRLHRHSRRGRLSSRSWRMTSKLCCGSDLCSRLAFRLWSGGGARNLNRM